MQKHFLYKIDKNKMFTKKYEKTLDRNEKYDYDRNIIHIISKTARRFCQEEHLL